MSLTETSTRTEPTGTPRAAMAVVAPQLPRYAILIVTGVAASLAAILGMAFGWGITGTVLLAWLVLLVAFPLWSLAVEGRRKAVNHLVAIVVWSAFALAMVPLVTIVFQVVSKGAGVLSVEFFTYSMRSVLGEGGGIYHALIGTAMITGMAALISVPIGVMSAIYLVEYGKGNRLAQVITFLVDVMTGIPSIVAGLFALALFTLVFGADYRSGFGGAVALSVLMIPIVVRSSEEMLKLVPDELREASYALGVPKWRTIVKVVLPTAVGGIVTGVTLAVARVTGETAPLLIIAGTTTSTNMNPFSERMATLPMFIFSGISEPGLYAAASTARAWGAALVLIAIVMALNVLARIIGKIFAPKTGR